MDHGVTNRHRLGRVAAATVVAVGAAVATVGAAATATAGAASAAAPPPVPAPAASLVHRAHTVVTSAAAVTSGRPAATAAKAPAATSRHASTKHHSSGPTATHGCPPAPPRPTGFDNQDLGFFTAAVHTAAADQRSGIATVTLTFRCYDPGETQNMTVAFAGLPPTGGGLPVTVLAGQPSFSFTGHRNISVVDAVHSFRLDPRSLGAPTPQGWYVAVDTTVAPDNSASRAKPILLPRHTAPVHVLPFSVRRVHSAASPAAVLPMTGIPTPSLIALGLLLMSSGMFLQLIGRRRATRNSR